MAMKDAVRGFLDEARQISPIIVCFAREIVTSPSRQMLTMLFFPLEEDGIRLFDYSFRFLESVNDAFFSRFSKSEGAEGGEGGGGRNSELRNEEANVSWETMPRQCGQVVFDVSMLKIWNVAKDAERRKARS